MITYTPIDSKRKKELTAIMAAGNIALTAMAEKFDFSNTKEFRKFLFRHKFSIDSMAKEIKIEDDFRETLGVEIKKVKAVRAIEMEMLSGYANLVRDLANKYYKIGSDDKDNYEQEGYIALVDAIYGYKNETIEFSTFGHTTVKNHLLSVLRYDNPLSPVSRDAMLLKRDFQALRLTIDGPCTDDEMFVMLSWSQSQIELYRCAEVKPVHGSALSGEEENNFDYSSLAKGIQDSEQKDFYAIEAAQQAVQNANLTDMERLVLETSCEPYYGWQTKLADDNINPDTGSPYSRRAIGYMLATATQKVKRAYARVAA